MPRKYTKRSDYWNKFNTHEKPLDDLAESTASTGPAFAGENFYVAEGSYIRNVRQPQDNESTRERCSTNVRQPACDKYSHIKALSLPYSYKENHISPRDSILMCQKAYANVPIFRNAMTRRNKKVLLLAQGLEFIYFIVSCSLYITYLLKY